MKYIFDRNNSKIEQQMSENMTSFKSWVLLLNLMVEPQPFTFITAPPQNALFNLSENKIYDQVCQAVNNYGSNVCHHFLPFCGWDLLNRHLDKSDQ